MSRSNSGSITPFIAMAVILIMGMVGVSVDMTRNFEAVRQLQFAAQTAALYGLSLATNSNGSYSTNSAQANISSAIVSAGAAGWNWAESGPPEPPSNQVHMGVSSQPVVFSNADIQFVPNPLDSQEFFVQVSGVRSDTTALQQYFLPLLYTTFSQGVPQSVRTFSSTRMVEVLGQPATRIGAGPPSSSPANSRAADLVGFATLPLAVSNLEFAPITSSSGTVSTYTIDLVSPASSTTTPGHLKGCLVNVSATGSGANFSNYYGSAQGNAAINQLEGLLNYFGAITGQPTILPATVENGSQLYAFNPQDPTFLSRQVQIAQAMATLPARFYIMPILAADPLFASANTVIGFAYLAITQVNFASNPPTITVTIGRSVPVRNASSATGFSGIPTNLGILLPPAVAPFLPRQWDPSTNGVTACPRGLVLGPALSPRPLVTQRTVTALATDAIKQVQ